MITKPKQFWGSVLGHINVIPTRLMNQYTKTRRDLSFRALRTLKFVPKCRAKKADGCGWLWSQKHQSAAVATSDEMQQHSSSAVPKGISTIRRMPKTCVLSAELKLNIACRRLSHYCQTKIHRWLMGLGTRSRRYFSDSLKIARSSHFCDLYLFWLESPTAYVFA